jgi:saposin
VHFVWQVEVVPQSEIGVRAIKKDETCELCEQLVKHLRDVLVSNTTEEEFKGVLTGICRQMRSFKPQVGKCYWGNHFSQST